MQLQQLFFLWPEVKQHFTAESFVQGISQDSRKIKPGYVFVAVQGHGSDGHQHIEDAIAKGALALVVQDLKSVPANYQGFVLFSADTRNILHFLATHFYGHPAQSLFCVGVTGTNGKTSTTLMVEWILNQHSFPCAVVGTIDRHFKEKKIETSLTTPDPVELQQNLSEFQKMGAKAFAMEVSSHALDQGRVDGVAFDVAVFTNLTQDHLDYHHSMEYYFLAKERLFREHLLKTLKLNAVAVVNADDHYGRRIRVPDRAAVLTFGQVKDADLRYRILKSDYSGTDYEVTFDGQKYMGRLPMIGVHNIANAVGAMGACLILNIPLGEMLKSLEFFPGVPGRLQRASPLDQQPVFVDYAHTPDALFQVLKALSVLRASETKIHVVFGCGGDRDRTKRPLMFEKVRSVADFVYVTSDNPRTENPLNILSDILHGQINGELRTGWVGSTLFVHEDRRMAIAEALKKSSAQDVVLIAGKGHENYQIIGTEKVHFSDAEEVQRFFQ